MATETGQAAAEVMRHLVEHPTHGYTQSSGRLGNGTIETIDYKGVTIRFAGGDRDCSAGVISAWKAVGDVVGVNLTGYASYTGDMRQGLKSTGLWEEKPMSFLAEPGDLYLNYVKGHVGMCYSQHPDMICEFLINEHGKIIGGQEGDQTGRESVFQPYRDFPWNCIMHYKGPDFMEELVNMPSANEIADAVWGHQIISSYDGTNQSAGNMLSWTNAAAQKAGNEILRTDDPSGRGQETDDHTRLAFMAAKQEAIDEKLDKIMAKLSIS